VVTVLGYDAKNALVAYGRLFVEVTKDIRYIPYVSLYGRSDNGELYPKYEIGFQGPLGGCVSSGRISINGKELHEDKERSVETGIDNAAERHGFQIPIDRPGPRQVAFEFIKTADSQQRASCAQVPDGPQQKILHLW